MIVPLILERQHFTIFNHLQIYPWTVHPCPKAVVKFILIQICVIGNPSQVSNCIFWHCSDGSSWKLHSTGLCFLQDSSLTDFLFPIFYLAWYLGSHRFTIIPTCAAWKSLLRQGRANPPSPFVSFQVPYLILGFPPFHMYLDIILFHSLNTLSLISIGRFWNKCINLGSTFIFTTSTLEHRLEKEIKVHLLS